MHKQRCVLTLKSKRLVLEGVQSAGSVAGLLSQLRILVYGLELGFENLVFGSMSCVLAFD